MIRQEELKQTDNVEVVERIYDELMLNGVNAIPPTLDKKRDKVFGKVCHDLVKQYVIWNDYIHSNNIMQLFKSVAFINKNIRKSNWFIRYEIIIYGRRTPLYFIDNPKILFNKIKSICSFEGESQKVEKQISRLSAAIESLFNYYWYNFLSEDRSDKESELFREHFINNFAKEYKKLDKDTLPLDITNVFNSFVDYIENPDKYIKPGVTYSEYELWEEDDDVVVQKYEMPNQENQKTVDVDELSPNELKFLNGKVIRFIGKLEKPSIKNKLRGISKRYGFEIEMFDDYEKLTNIDFSNMKYSKRISGIIVGPMPHKVKGIGNYSSCLEMFKSEPGYPPVFECYAGEKLKITATSLWRALLELNKVLESN